LSSNLAGAAKTARAVCSDIDAQPANTTAIIVAAANPSARRTTALRIADATARPLPCASGESLSVKTLVQEAKTHRKATAGIPASHRIIVQK
jgi:hypothetical protein